MIQSYEWNTSQQKRHVILPGSDGGMHDRGWWAEPDSGTMDVLTHALSLRALSAETSAPPDGRQTAGSPGHARQYFDADSCASLGQRPVKCRQRYAPDHCQVKVGGIVGR